MKASEVRLMVAIASQYGCKLLKTDTKQASLNGEIGDGQSLKDMLVAEVESV